MVSHAVPKKVYFMVFASLLVLTAATTGVAFIDLGEWNTVVALLIAVCKATLVAAFFMHLRWSPRLMRIVLLSALLWLAILVCLTTMDFFSRNWTTVPAGWSESLLLRSPNASPRFHAPHKTVRL